MMKMEKELGNGHDALPNPSTLLHIFSVISLGGWMRRFERRISLVFLTCLIHGFGRLFGSWFGFARGRKTMY